MYLCIVGSGICTKEYTQYAVYCIIILVKMSHPEATLRKTFTNFILKL